MKNFSPKQVNVLFVCMGNICRSPTAEGVFAKLAQQHGLEHLIGVDSAGTHAYHSGEPADRRAQDAARERGYDLSFCRARKLLSEDFETFDYVLVMDRDNYNNALEITPKDKQHRLKLFLDYADDKTVGEVPDPYYGGVQGFEVVLDLVEDAALGLLKAVRETHHL